MSTRRTRIQTWVSFFLLLLLLVAGLGYERRDRNKDVCDAVIANAQVLREVVEEAYGDQQVQPRTPVQLPANPAVSPELQAYLEQIVNGLRSQTLQTQREGGTLTDRERVLSQIPNTC